MQRELLSTGGNQSTTDVADLCLTVQPPSSASSIRPWNAMLPDRRFCIGRANDMCNNRHLVAVLLLTSDVRLLPPAAAAPRPPPVQPRQSARHLIRLAFITAAS